MKRIIAILLFTLYASSAIGIGVKLHYCRGRLAHVSILNFYSKPSCPLDVTKIPKACCQDQLVYQSLDKHNVVEALSAIEFIPFVINPSTGDYALKHHSDSNIHQYLAIVIDRSCLEPIYLLNRVLLI